MSDAQCIFQWHFLKISFHISWYIRMHDIFSTLSHVCLSSDAGPGVCSRVPHSRQHDRSGHLGHVQAGDREPATDAGQVSLRVQPAGLLQDHPGCLPHQEGAGGEQARHDQVRHTENQEHFLLFVVYFVFALLFLLLFYRVWP